MPDITRCEFMKNDVPWRDSIIPTGLDIRAGHLHISERPRVDLIEEKMEKYPGILDMDERDNFYV